MHDFLESVLAAQMVGASGGEDARTLFLSSFSSTAQRESVLGPVQSTLNHIGVEVGRIGGLTGSTDTEMDVAVVQFSSSLRACRAGPSDAGADAAAAAAAAAVASSSVQAVVSDLITVTVVDALTDAHLDVQDVTIDLPIDWAMAAEVAQVVEDTRRSTSARTTAFGRMLSSSPVSASPSPSRFPQSPHRCFSGWEETDAPAQIHVAPPDVSDRCGWWDTQAQVFSTEGCVGELRSNATTKQAWVRCR
jgi:hypothetical protein